MDASSPALSASLPSFSSTPTWTANERKRAVLAYVFSALGGLVVYLSADRTERYARWNAMQALLLGCVAFALMVLLNIASIVLAFVGIRTLFSSTPYLALGHVVLLVLLPFSIVLAVRAHRGRPMRLPILGKQADRWS
jgi:uncharacterized membrane protein